MPNEYWSGTREAHLDREHITARWAQGDYSSRRIDFANQIFHFWWLARQGIAACTDLTEREAMTRELEDAGRTGWGVGIDDLEEAFNHLHAAGGIWTNETQVGHYAGGTNKFCTVDVRNMPIPFVAFANAVDSKMTIVRNALSHYHNAASLIDTQLHTGHPDWNQIYHALCEIKDFAVGVGPFLWARPRPPGGAYAPPHLASERSATVSFAGALTRIVSGVMSYRTARDSHFPAGQAAAIGFLRTAVAFVPVMGGYYGAMVELIPTLRTAFTNMTDEYIRRIDRAAFGWH